MNLANAASSTVLVRGSFPIQSFFDNTQLNQALLAQAANSPIVSGDSTRQVKGRLIGLHPASQTPVAVRLKAGNRSGGDNTVILTPGQIYRVRSGGFDGLEWGLPYGWLGGGVAQLHVADNEDAFFGWSQSKVEVLIQRLRLKIVADAAPPAVSSALYNWPTRFPWPNAPRYNAVTPATPIIQGGAPILAVEPTRVVMRLRLAIPTASGPQTMRMIMQGDNGFDIGSDGLTPGVTDLSAVEVVWPVNNGAVSAPYPVIEMDAPGALLGGDAAVMTLTDLTNAGVLLNQYVDILRFGKV